MEIRAEIEIIIEVLRECELYSQQQRYKLTLKTMDCALELIKELKEEILMEM